VKSEYKRLLDIFKKLNAFFGRKEIRTLFYIKQFTMKPAMKEESMKELTFLRVFPVRIRAGKNTKIYRSTIKQTIMKTLAAEKAFRITSSR